jgi:putative transposase
MARLAPKELSLSDSEQNELQELIKGHKTAQQIVIRAKIILLASSGKNNGEIARILEISLDMTRLWRKRWLETQGAKLSAVQRLQEPIPLF